jgi:hypothetical protein
LAVKSGNLAFIKYLVEERGCDINQFDILGREAISTLLCGNRILKASAKILEYLLQRGASPNIIYGEKSYG